MSEVDSYYVQLSKENILQKTTQENIMEYYLGFPVDRNRTYSNPLRKDNNPGCRFWYNNNKKLYFNDFAGGFMWDCFAVVQYKYKLNFWDALNRINKDLNLGLNTVTTISKTTNPHIDIKPLKKVTIQSIPTAWTESTLAYWKSYGISKETLDKYFVYNTSIVYIDGNISMRSTDKNPIFTYLFPPSTHIKIYRPLAVNKIQKWKSTTTKSDIDGIHQLPKKGKLLIITSSRKDVMLLNEYGFSAISCSSEIVLLQPKIYKKLSKRFKYIITFMDADNAGYETASKYFDKYNIRSIHIEKRYGHKDITDFRKKFKHDKTYKQLKRLIKNCFNKSKLPY